MDRTDDAKEYETNAEPEPELPAALLPMQDPVQFCLVRVPRPGLLQEPPEVAVRALEDGITSAADGSLLGNAVTPRGFAFTSVRIDEADECPACYRPEWSTSMWEIDATQPEGLFLKNFASHAGKMTRPRIELGFPRPQRGVLTSILSSHRLLA